MIGKKYGMRTVLSEEGLDKNGAILYLCKCECGKEKIVNGSSIRKSLSCGCKNYHPSIHKLSGTRIYRIWCGILKRCFDKKSPGYKYYGARGIGVSEKWKSFPNFFNDMGHPPFGCSVERKNNNEGYSKDNCKWATIKEQNNNKRNIRKITYQGITMNMTEWANHIGTSPPALHHRIVKLGIPIELALSIPFTRSNSAKKFTGEIK